MLIKSESYRRTRNVRQHTLPNVVEQKAQAEQNRKAFLAAANKLQWALQKIEELQMQVEAAQKAGFDEGFQAGKEAGWADGQAQIQEQVSNLANIAGDLRRQQTEVVTTAKQFVVSFVFKILERLIRTEQIQQAGLSTDQLQQLADDVISHFSDATKFTFRLHRDTAVLLREHQVQIEKMLKGPLVILEDPSLQLCDCLVETDFGVLDARIGSQLREIARFFTSSEGLV